MRAERKVLILGVILSLIVPAAISQRDLSPTAGCVEIIYPPDGSIIKGTVTIKVVTAGCIDMVEFYIDDELKYIDTIAPFSYTWESTEQTPGEHKITVKGYCSGEFQDSDSIRVKVL